MNNEQTIELHCTSFKIFLDSVVTAPIWPDTPEEAAALFLSLSVRWHLVTASQEESPKKAAITGDFLMYAYGFLMPQRSEKSHNNMHKCMHQTGPQVAFLVSSVLYISVSSLCHALLRAGL